MTDFDPIEFGKGMAAMVKEAIAPIRQELEAVKAVKPEKGEPGKDAEVDLDALADLVVSKLLDSDRVATLVDLAATEAVAKHFEANPVQHGKDAELPDIEGMVAKAVAAIPAPKDGKDAEPVSDRAIAEHVAKYLEANPPAAGKDAAGIADTLIDRDGCLVATYTDGRTKNLGPVVGKDGADFTKCEIDYDGERTITVRGDGGEIKKHVPIPMDRGYWRDGTSCEKGDILTHDGNAWIALRETKAKPCHENKEDWRLFARRGRDGQDGKKVFVEREPVKLEG